MGSTNNPTRTDWDAVSWIEPAKHGDARAMERALEPFRPYLTMIARRALRAAPGNTIDPADLVQETFLAAHRGIANFQGSTEGQWRAWLRIILMHHLANSRRAHLVAQKKGYERPTPKEDAAVLGARLPSTITPPPRRLQLNERDRAIRAALAKLPERDREVVVWHHDDGLTFEAVGDRLGISADAARKRWNRALIRLQAILGPTHDPR
jgi:RNA polymerase sigma-70 factor (ECF subfamily)